MSIHYTAEAFAPIANWHESPARQTRLDCGFELPKAVYVTTVASYFAFLAVMMATFRNAEIGLVMAICAVYITMAFGTPALWTRMAPSQPINQQSWKSFVRHGIETHTGKTGCVDATIQVLILPVLILCWGVGIALIVAAV